MANKDGGTNLKVEVW